VIDNVPAEIVRRLLERGFDVATRTAHMVTEFTEMKSVARAALSGIIETIPDAILDGVDAPDLSAVDGGMICESRSIGDFCSAVAVSAGSTEDSGGCDIWMESVPRHPRNKEVLGGIMSSMEVSLAHSIPGKLVMMDGAFLSTLINVSKAIHSSRQVGRNAVFERAVRLVSEIYDDKRVRGSPSRQSRRARRQNDRHPGAAAGGDDAFPDQAEVGWRQ
jgi:hypothetical protein